MTTEEALVVIYAEMGWKIVDTDMDNNLYCCKLTNSGLRELFTSPIANTLEGLAEFGRLVVWAVGKFVKVEFRDINKPECCIVVTGGAHICEKADTTQEAFIQALAAAI
jgi:hypothetical protein